MMALQQPIFGFSIAQLLAGVVQYGFYIMMGLILVWIVFGWIGYPSSDAMQRLHDFVTTIINPIIMPIRSRIPPIRLGGFGLDLSPIILIIGLFLLRGLLNTIIQLFIAPVTG
ncbi:MAG: YggT family protein [Rubrobacter sp.]|nr:YggT family protein [Rubrobacter sp.]